jgi:hypothetical protein
MSSINERNRNRERKEEQEETLPSNRRKPSSSTALREVMPDKKDANTDNDTKEEPKDMTPEKISRTTTEIREEDSEEDRKPKASSPPKKKSKTTKDIRIEDSKENIEVLPPASAALRKVVYKAAGALGLLEQGDTFFGDDTIEQLEGIGVLTVREFVKSVLVINYKLGLKGDMEFEEVVLQAILDASLEIMTVDEM